MDAVEIHVTNEDGSVYTVSPVYVHKVTSKWITGTTIAGERFFPVAKVTKIFKLNLIPPRI